MKIAIDISPIIYGTGVSTYTKNLVETLLSIDSQNEYLLFGGSLRSFKKLKKMVKDLSEKAITKKTKLRFFLTPPSLAHIIWNQLHVLPTEKLIGKVDVFHSSDWSQPPSSAFKVTTIHDLVPIKYPRLSRPKIVAAHKARFKWIKKEVDRIIVPSKATKEELVDLGILKKRIIVIPEAPDPIFKRSKKTKVYNLRKKYRISGKYLLSVGVAPRKNTDRIINAFEKIKSGGMKLVIIGGLKSQVLYKRGVINLGYVAKEDLPTLYSGAEALVYPSLYEGFGLPILEAFASKLPVVTSNSSSMKEVAGDAAVLVDSYSVNSIANGILSAFKNRKSLTKKGWQRVKEYSWKKTAERTLDVYRESVKNGKK